ncbi:MAG: thioredoxin family protein [Clostridia bacterium]|nr:thioredoxin family protein [Clostridia bacterium]
MTDVNKENFEAEVERCEGLAVIDLYADWCGPCRLLAPVIEELEREYPDVKFCRINVDEEPELTAAFKVESIPMIALVKNNTFLDFSVGYVAKATLVRLIESNK